MGDVVSRDQLTKQGMKGAFGVAGGVALLVVRALAASGPIGAFIVGGVVGLIGLAMTKNKEDRKAGLVALAAGAVTVLAFALPGIRDLALTLLLLSGIGLIGLGAWSLVKFFKNLKSRS